MASNQNPQQSVLAPIAPPLFMGFPYLVSRIGANRHHIIPLPLSGTFDYPRLREIAHVQARLNQLPVCLVLGSEACLFIRPDESEYVSSNIPSAAFVESERLSASELFPEMDDLSMRQDMLRTFAQRLRSSYGGGNNFIIGDPTKGGRALQPGEEESLQGVQENGVPKGLMRCPHCGEFRGECLASPSGLVISVHCRCQNDNLCAGCFTPLFERKLNAFFYSESDKCVWYVPGYLAFDHNCPKIVGSVPRVA